jgi:hypothetical protein
MIKKKGNVNGRRQNALARLQKNLQDWNKHSNPKMKNGIEIRSHEAEKVRLEKEIENVTKHINGQF